MKIDPYCQQQKCSRPVTLVSGYMGYMQIFVGAAWASNYCMVVNNGKFQPFLVAVSLETLEKRPE